MTLRPIEAKLVDDLLAQGGYVLNFTNQTFAEIQGRIIHFDKAKYEESILLGVERDVGDDFLIERINPKNASV
ncbi:hypothetical protein [Rhizobium sp. 862_C5_N1_2]|uniref:hypothetical protein n=1 Tax=Rhizobium sp. 862_C5_N1_2 TaxID=3276277 RepID=UPI003F220E5C